MTQKDTVAEVWEQHKKSNTRWRRFTESGDRSDARFCESGGCLSLG